MASQRQRPNNRRYNRQHIFLWMGLIVLALAVLSITVYLITGGQKKSSLAQNSFSFIEDFTSTANLDTGVTNLQQDATAGEVSLYNGYWTHITDRGIIGHEATPDWIKPNQEESIFSIAFKVNPITNEPNAFFVVAKPDYLPKEDKLYFSRYDRTDKRWETMKGVPGRENISDLFGSASHMITVNSGPGRLLVFNSQGDPYLMINRRAPTSPYSFSPWFLRWCPNLVGGSWGNADCSAGGPESLDTPSVHDLANGLIVDTGDRPHVTIFDGISNFTPCPSINPQVKDINGGTLQAGDTLEYTLWLKNRTGQPVSGASITSDMPSNVQYLTVTSLPAGYVDNSTSGYLDISNVSLASNQTDKVIYQVQVKPGTANDTVLANTATLTRGLTVNNRSKSVTVGQAVSDASGPLSCNTGIWYTHFDGSS